MNNLLLIWVGLLAALILFAVRKPGAGGVLILSYFLGLSLIHVPGALLFLDPQSIVPGETETELGFYLTIIGMTGFVSGAVLARWTYGNRPDLDQPDAVAVSAVFAPHIWRMIIIGVISYFVIMPLANVVPSGTVLVSSLAALLVVGLWLRFYDANLRRDMGATLTTLCVVPLLPLATLTSTGFIGFGVYWALSVLTFLFVITNRRFWFYLGAPAAGIIGLSLFATYISLRTDIRSVVWGEGAGLAARLSSIASIITDFRLLDLSSPLLLYAVNGRLNQNYLVGVGAERYQAGTVELTYGNTIQLWALIPRVVWPDKPPVGGGGDIVTNFTGITFAEGTSVGVGQVLEFYMNFGMLGLIVGFVVLGFVLMRLDFGIVRALRTGDMNGLLLYAMPGLTLMQPGGNLLEILVAFVGAMVAARMLIFTDVFGARSGSGLRLATSESGD
jgi:hypothetical protein